MYWRTTMLRQTKVKNGLLQGIPGADPRITIYRKIPFAAPPVGENRFRAPQPASDWEGVRDCARFGALSVQDRPSGGDGLYDREWHVDNGVEISEDCLYLNVWTPAKSTDENLPVLVWFFGGGFQWGYPSEMEFDGEHLARRGVIVVSVNYRLNCFGFLAHPDITKEAPQAPSNFGLLDQEAGLHWVYENIEAFGGDKERITIAGQSAGGSSTMHQLVNEKNRHIVKGAIILSGIIRHPDEGADIFKPLSLAEAEKRGEDFFASLGVKTLAEARALPADEILQGYNRYVQDHPRMFPIEDGQFCTGEPVERFIKGDCAQAPVISGNTADEFIDHRVNIVERSVKSAFTDALKEDPSRKLYYYRFDPDIPGDGVDMPGTFHSCDLWFFFETLGKCHRPYAGRHFDLARQMCDYIANFIKTGDPNGIGRDFENLPTWNPYSCNQKDEMEFTSHGAVPKREGGIRQNSIKQAVNPYLPGWETIPDGEPYVFNGRVYIYGSHDIFGGETFCQDNYVCWSAPVDDLGNWHYEGISYHTNADPLNKNGEMCLYAPDVTKGPDGRYYLYYVLDKVCIVSVAVSDTPAGPFEFYGYVHYEDGTKLGEKEGDEPQFDPGVLTEGDETYLYTGFCGQGDKSRHGAMFTVLGPDMLTVKKAPEIIVPGSCYSEGTGYKGHAFFEAPSIRKHGDTYYFVYSSEVMHELCYATSKSPAGPFTYGGVIVSNCDMHIGTYKPADKPTAPGANNHGSIVEIGDDWYIFYHRHTNGNWFSRQGCAEKIQILEDGSIPQVEITSCGLNQGPLSDKGEYPSYIACNLFSDHTGTYVAPSDARIVQDITQASHRDSYIKDIQDTCVIGFKYFDMQHVTGIRVRTRGYFNGTFDVLTDLNKAPEGHVSPAGSNIWTSHEGDFSPENGVHALYLRYNGSGSCNLASIELLHKEGE